MSSDSSSHAPNSTRVFKNPYVSFGRFIQLFSPAAAPLEMGCVADFDRHIAPKVRAGASGRCSGDLLIAEL
jgi:hypothetical protein